MKRSFFLISFILLALCFLPALCLPFAHHDNVRFFDKFYTPHSVNPDQRDPQHSIIYLLGRPLTGEIQQVIYTHVSNLGDLRIIRWLTVSVFALCAGLLANIFYSLGLTTLESLCLSVVIFTLPGVQDAIIMLAIQNALAIWAVLWAYVISCKAHRSSFEDMLNALVIFCLILTSMFLYPQWSFFIFTPVLVKYLMAPKKDLRSIHQEIWRLTSFFGITAIFYYFFIKTFVSFNNARAGSYAFTIDLNFLYWKFLSIFSKILPMAFNFWNFHTITWVGWALMGLTLALLRKRAFLCFLMIICTSSFWLLARTDLILHRIFFVTSVFALAAFLISVRNAMRGDGKIARYIIIWAMTAGLVSVHYLTFYNASNYHLEFSFIKQRLLAYQKPFSRIHIVLAAHNGKGYNGQETVGDTFNARTASYNFTTDTLNLVRAALKDINIPTSWWVYSCEDDQQQCVKQMPPGYRLLITHSNQGQPVYYSPGMVLIDLNEL